jgi:quercetin dioxygenase-like cupin family protein
MIFFMKPSIHFPYPQNDDSYQLPDKEKMDGNGRIEKPFNKPGGRTRRAQFVMFSDGGFTKWHYHTGEQILFAVEGKGFVELEGKPKILLQAGENAYIPENVRHRHGAIENEQRFIHLAVTAGETCWKESGERDFLADLISINAKILQAEEEGSKEAQDRLEPILAKDFCIVRASGVKQDRQTFLDAMPKNAHLGRFAEAPEIQIFSDCAVYSCRLTTLRKPDGTEITRNFWNTRLFLREGGQWRCQMWQVTEFLNA